VGIDAHKKDLFTAIPAPPDEPPSVGGPPPSFLSSLDARAIVLDAELIDEFCLENEQSWKRMQAGRPAD
jgi:hypothetical protein